MSRQQRRLAAILAADVAGWSRLMGRDEAGTLARLKAHRGELLDPRIAEHRGRIVKTTGDGLLVEFASVVDAAACAIEVQRAMAVRNGDLADNNRIAFRIGIHVGDIIADDDDIFGDGVNIAARLEGIAEAGGICLSDDAQRQLRGKIDAAFDDLGERALKNIALPMKIWRLRLGSEAVPIPRPDRSVPESVGALALPDRPSIAVLPFQNMSGDSEQEYFADGMVEDIITALSRFKSLFVIARNSSFAYKGKSPDVKQVGRELGVRYVLEGSVRKAAGKVRITGQLIDCETGAHLWADRFDGALDDVFELQDRVASSVVGAIAPKLDQAEMERSRRKPVDNLDSYDCYLRGLAHTHDLTRESWDEALRLFLRAIGLDPGFATPHGLAARCYTIRWMQGWTVDRMREEADARRLALRVAAIGQDDALALCAAGHALIRICREYDTGAAMIDQAISINPNLAICWQQRGHASMVFGQHEAALEQIGRALRFSPLDPETWRSEGVMAQTLVLLGRYDEALTWATRALARQPAWMPALRAAAAAAALAGQRDEAQKTMTRIRLLDPAMRVSQLDDFLPFRRPEDTARMADGLRLAGMPA